MKTIVHPTVPPSHESTAAPSLSGVVDPPDNQPAICQGATRKKTKRELESKVRQCKNLRISMLREEQQAIFDPVDSGLAFSSIPLKVRGRGYVLGTKIR